MFKKLFSLILILIFYHSLNQPLLAQSESTLIGVAPAILEQVLTVNSKKEFHIFVYNLSSNPLPIKSNVQKFTPNEETHGEDDLIFNSQNWITVYPQEFILKPQEKKDIKIIISTPPKVEPGGHYATIFFEPLIQKSELNSQKINVSTKVGLLTLLIIKGNISESSEISQFQTRKFWQFSPIEFNIKIKNTGNIHFFPHGHLIIKNFRKKEVARLDLPPTLILPQTIKTIPIEWSKKHLFGLYFAQLEFDHISNHQKLNPKLFFWVIPIISVVIFILLTSIVIYLTINYRKFKQAVQVLFKKNNSHEPKIKKK